MQITNRTSYPMPIAIQTNPVYRIDKNAKTLRQNCSIAFINRVTTDRCFLPIYVTQTDAYGKRRVRLPDGKFSKPNGRIANVSLTTNQLATQRP